MKIDVQPGLDGEAPVHSWSALQKELVIDIGDFPGGIRNGEDKTLMKRIMKLAILHG
jgi:hypothetical protein